MPFPVTNGKTWQTRETGNQPLLEKQIGGTLRRISYLHFEFISNGEEREKVK